MTYEMPAIADTVDLEACLGELSYSAKCLKCDDDW